MTLEWREVDKRAGRNPRLFHKEKLMSDRYVVAVSGEPTKYYFVIDLLDKIDGKIVGIVAQRETKQEALAIAKRKNKDWRSHAT